ncbi:MAG TPA: nuclear transport factor 2 family protein [Thermoanaerobaculia bacterium]|nr:nuclear transport factor 2 family protein [Thermoanaerobaculia bacterium]
MWKTIAVLLMLAVLPAPVKRTVREELDAQYAKLADANVRKDIPAIMALKSDTFYTIGPHGELNDRVSMEAYSRRFLEPLRPPIVIKQTILDITVSEHELVAIVHVHQEVSRFREIEGVLRKIETSVTQRETWVKQDGEWKLQFVDEVKDQKTLVDGKPIVRN